MSLPDFDRHIDYTAYYGQYVQKARLNGDQLTGLCPLHPEKRPSFSVNLKTGQWICRSSCGSGNVIDFHARIHNMINQEAVEDLKKKYLPQNSSSPQPTKKPPLSIKTLEELSPLPEKAVEYLTTKRGWSKEIIEKHGIKYHDKGRRKAIAIPVFENGELVNIRTYAPETANKIMSWGKGLGEARLYPEEMIERARAAGHPVILCEGEPDALCGLSHGLHCVTQTAGAETWKDHWNARFKGLEVLICYDNDDAGRKGAERVAQHLPHFAKSVSAIQWPEWMEDREDLTDWFVKYGKSAEELLLLPRSEMRPQTREQHGGVDQRLEELNRQFSVVMLGGKCLIMKQIRDPIFGRKDVIFSSFGDFRNFFSNEKYWLENGNGKAKKQTISDIWLNQPTRSQYQGIVFSPNQDVTEMAYYNMWQGLAVEPRKGDCGRLLEHIFENIAQRDSAIYQYVMSWMAEIVQRPGGKRPGVALVLRGKQGVGKGCLAEYFGKILGNHFLHVTQANQITGKFNNHLKDALLVFADEAFWAGDKNSEGVLKGMITEDLIMIEPKGKDPFPVRNHVRLMVASNNDWLVPAGPQERRFCVLEVSDRHQQDHQYFGKIFKEMANGGREALLYTLLEANLEGFDFYNFPKTEALFDQKLSSMSSVGKFWFECLRRGGMRLPEQHDTRSDTYARGLIWEERISTQELYRIYLNECRDRNDRHPFTDIAFVKKLKELCPSIRRKRASGINGARLWEYQIGALEECRKAFEETMKTKVKWEEDD